MTKLYCFDGPEQLKEIAKLCKDGSQRVMNVAKIWNSAKVKNGTTPWDGKVMVRFSTEGTSRKAEVIRSGFGGTTYSIAELRYNLALQWCVQHLRKVDCP